MSDHYDPSSRTLRLSPDVYGGRTVTAAGIAAHEVGHALQHKKGYAAILQLLYWLFRLGLLGGRD